MSSNTSSPIIHCQRGGVVPLAFPRLLIKCGDFRCWRPCYNFSPGEAQIKDEQPRGNMLIGPALSAATLLELMHFIVSHPTILPTFIINDTLTSPISCDCFLLHLSLWHLLLEKMLNLRLGDSNLALSYFTPGSTWLLWLRNRARKNRVDNPTLTEQQSPGFGCTLISCPWLSRAGKGTTHMPE